MQLILARLALTAVLTSMQTAGHNKLPALACLSTTASLFSLGRMPSFDLLSKRKSGSSAAYDLMKRRMS